MGIGILLWQETRCRLSQGRGGGMQAVLQKCYRGHASVTVLQKCYRRQASVTVLQSPGQGTDGGMCDGTYVRELVHVNVTRYELWATSRMPPVLCHNLWGRVYHQ